MALEFTNGLTATATVTEDLHMVGIRWAIGWPGVCVTPEIDLDAIGDRTVGLTITIPN